MRRSRSTGVNGLGLAPALGIDRLAVVVRVEEERALRPRHPKLGKDERVAAGFEDLGSEAALGEQVRSRSALRLTFSRSAATLGIDSSSTNSRDDRLLVRGDELLDRPAGVWAEHAIRPRVDGTVRREPWRRIVVWSRMEPVMDTPSPPFYFPLLTFSFLY